MLDYLEFNKYEQEIMIKKYIKENSAKILNFLDIVLV